MIGLGTIVGELIGIERFFDKFVNAFVTASLTVCIGAMAIVGAIQDGILGDYSILAVKAVLDLIIIAIMTSSMGKNCSIFAVEFMMNYSLKKGNHQVFARWLPFLNPNIYKSI